MDPEKKSKLLLSFETFRTSRLWFAGADVLAMLLAAVLPWSTTAFAIFLGSLLAIICGSLDIRLFVRSVNRAPSVICITLFILAAAGVFWSEAGFSAGIHALSPLVKFLVLPLLLYYFEISKRGTWVLGAFLISCFLLMIDSWVITFEPSLAFKTGRCCGGDYGVSVRNYIDQSQEFAICLVGLASAALFCVQRKMWKVSALLCVTAMAFAANLIFVVVSRTAIISIPIMFIVLAWRHGRMRSILSVIGIGGVVIVAAWLASPHLRTRVFSAYSQFQEYRDYDVPSSVGKRLEFWRKSLGFVRDAPLLGHGTGSALKLFEEAAVGQSGVAAEVVANPHNQTFSVAVQWGIAGLIVLYALWFFHLRMFLADGFVAELGIILIVQNMIGSLFNSHLFDFTEGWLYVLGVGVTGGILAKRHAADKAESPAITGPIAK